MPPTLLCLAALLAPTADPKPVAYTRPELLIEAEELKKPEALKAYRVLDVRPAAQYKEGHVPGAVPLDAAAWDKAFTEGQDEKKWAALFAAVGVLPTSKVVVYDDNLSRDAARIWWILRYWGVQEVRLLNGGWKAWRQSSGAVDTKQDFAAPTGLPTLKPEAKRLATKTDLLEELKKGEPGQVVDARSAKEFCGDDVRAQRGGAIPGARHLEWSDLLDNRTGKFKPAPELAKVFADGGIDPQKPATTYCQSGGRASVMAFGLELMGGKNVRNYYRSWNEWGNSDDTPIVKPKKP
jgi:thiosulfate/3-mercaptopyruvate sulfurtransferase